MGLSTGLNSTSRLFAFAIVLVLASTVCRTSDAQAQAAEPNISVAVIVDGSRSMWGRLGGVSKIETIRAVLPDTCGRIPPFVRIALRTFGLGKLPEREDSTPLISLAPRDCPAIEKALRRINPKSQSPVAFALSEAMVDLGSRDARRLIVYIGDSGDPFHEQDMCGTIRDMAVQHGNIEINVLGLDLDEKDELSLRCVSRETGGRFFHIEKGEDLRTAMYEVIQGAVLEEREAIAREIERKRLRKEEEKRTRIVVHFTNEIPPFFADHVALATLALDGTPREPMEQGIAPGKELTVLNIPVQPGKHTLSIRYEKWKNGKGQSSKAVELPVEVEWGRTSQVFCRATAHLFHWGLDTLVTKDSGPYNLSSSQDGVKSD